MMPAPTHFRRNKSSSCVGDGSDGVVVVVVVAAAAVIIVVVVVVVFSGCSSLTGRFILMPLKKERRHVQSLRF